MGPSIFALVLSWVSTSTVYVVPVVVLFTTFAKAISTAILLPITPPVPFRVKVTVCPAIPIVNPPPIVEEETNAIPEMSKPAGNVTRILPSLGIQPSADVVKLTVYELLAPALASAGTAVTPDSAPEKPSVGSKEKRMKNNNRYLKRRIFPVKQDFLSSHPLSTEIRSFMRCSGIHLFGNIFRIFVLKIAYNSQYNKK